MNSAKRRRKLGKIRRKMKNRLYWMGWGVCYYCHKKLTLDTKTIDHKVPISKGGTHHFKNLCIACKKCNKKKSDMSEEEWEQIVTRYQWTDKDYE